MPDDPAASGPPQGQDRNSPSSGGTPRRPAEPDFLDFLVLGTACALAIIVAGGLGYLLDSWLGTTPWLTFAGLAFGIVSAVLMAVNRLRPYL